MAKESAQLAKGDTSHKPALTSDTSPKFGGPQNLLSSEQLAINSGVPMTTLRFDNLLEQLIEFKKVLFLGIVFYCNQMIKYIKYIN